MAQKRFDEYLEEYDYVVIPTRNIKKMVQKESGEVSISTVDHKKTHHDFPILQFMNKNSIYGGI